MKITKEDIQESLLDLGGEPMFKGCDKFSLYGEMIPTDEIENVSQLIKIVFKAGEMARARARAIRNALKINEG